MNTVSAPEENKKTAPLFHRLVAVLDSLAPERGAFSYAADWADRLHLPLCGVTLPVRGERAQASNGKVSGVVRAGESALERACAGFCAARGISWEPSGWLAISAGSECPLAAGDLLVFGQALPSASKQLLLRQAQRSETLAMLVCPNTWSPVTRVLLVDQESEASRRLLEKAAVICRALRAELIVLTAARSERTAFPRQHVAEEALASCGVKVDFDILIGSELRMAVSGVARWRRCQVVLMERHAAPPWWRWLRGDKIKGLLGGTDLPAFLFLPCPATANYGSVG
jgi:uncharacterized protein YbaR (Trm112 family)